LIEVLHHIWVFLPARHDADLPLEALSDHLYESSPVNLLEFLDQAWREGTPVAIQSVTDLTLAECAESSCQIEVDLALFDTVSVCFTPNMFGVRFFSRTGFGSI
jgi:hypothetical protein